MVKYSDFSAGQKGTHSVLVLGQTANGNMQRQPLRLVASLEPQAVRASSRMSNAEPTERLSVALTGTRTLTPLAPSNLNGCGSEHATAQRLQAASSRSRASDTASRPAPKKSVSPCAAPSIVSATARKTALPCEQPMLPTPRSSWSAIGFSKRPILSGFAPTKRRMVRNRRARILGTPEEALNRRHPLALGTAKGLLRPLPRSPFLRRASTSTITNRWLAAVPNDRNNLRLLHKRCNQSKSARDPIEYAREHGLLCW